MSRSAWNCARKNLREKNFQNALINLLLNISPNEKIIMKILYDHQIFTAQKYGGISRYYCELYSHISQVPDIKPKIKIFPFFVI